MSVPSLHTLMLDSKMDETQRSILSTEESTVRIQLQAYKKVLNQIEQLILNKQNKKLAHPNFDPTEIDQQIQSQKELAQMMYQSLIKELENSNLVGMGAENLEKVDEHIAKLESSSTLSSISEGESASVETQSRSNRNAFRTPPPSNSQEARTNRSSNRTTVDEVTKTNYDTSQDVKVKTGDQAKVPISEIMANKIAGIARSNTNKEALNPASASSSRVSFNVQNPASNNQTFSNQNNNHNHNFPDLNNPPHKLPTNLLHYLFGRWGGKKHMCGVAYDY